MATGGPANVAPVAEVGLIPAHKMGRLWRFRRRDIEVWLRGAGDRR